MAYALSRPERLTAALNFSGFLADGLEIVDSGRVPPIYWGHGLHDPSIPHALAVRGRARLVEAGVDVTPADHPIGHGIVPDEIAEAVAVVERALG
jgi:phospholipase/carboxylesterase